MLWLLQCHKIILDLTECMWLSDLNYRTCHLYVYVCVGGGRWACMCTYMCLCHHLVIRIVDHKKIVLHRTASLSFVFMRKEIIIKIVSFFWQWSRRMQGLVSCPVLRGWRNTLMSPWRQWSTHFRMTSLTPSHRSNKMHWQVLTWADCVGLMFSGSSVCGWMAPTHYYAFYYL